MPVIVEPLIAGLAHQLDNLKRLRLAKPIHYVLPEWADACLPDPIPEPPCAHERELRALLATCAEQVRRIGADVWVRRVLAYDRMHLDQRYVLIAAAGFAPWHDQSTTRLFQWSRHSADHLTYRISTEIAGPAPYAEHAAEHLVQRLYIAPASDDEPPAMTVTGNHGFCLSLICAVRDVIVHLLQAGRTHLATELALLSGLDRAILPADLPVMRNRNISGR